VDTFKHKGALSVDEFCGWASIGRSKFYQEVAAGRIRLRKIGRKSVVTMPDALAWLSELPELKLANQRANTSNVGQ